MLTIELLKANAATAGLTDEQLNAISEMSRNDEAAVIGQKTGEIYGGLDADILAASGIAKNGTEKTYDYAKRVIGEIKGQADSVAGLQAQLADLTKEKERLDGVIAKGGADAETKRALEQARADLANVTKEYTDLKTKYDNSEAEHAKALLGVRMDAEFASAGAGLKFKADLPEAVKGVVLSQAIDRVKGLNPEYIDDGQGGKVLAFMQNGTPMRNPETNLKPYTAAELVANELRQMGVLEIGRKATGTGSQETTPSGGASDAADLSGARTQTEANEIITKSLLSQGLTIGSKAYQERFDKIWKDNATILKALPLR